MENEYDITSALRKTRADLMTNASFLAWRETLPPYTRQIVDELLDHNVTEGMIIAADHSPEPEWDKYTFIRALGGGTSNPTMAEDLTDTVLGLLPWDMGREKRIAKYL